MAGAGGVVKGAAVGRVEARNAHAVPVPRSWRPSAAGRVVAAGFRSISDPIKVAVELLPEGGSRQVRRPKPLPEGVLTCFNSFENLIGIDNEGGGEVAAAEAAENGEDIGDGVEEQEAEGDEEA